MKKRILSLMLALAMVVAIMPMTVFAEDNIQEVSGNLLKVTSIADFEAGTMEGVNTIPAKDGGIWLDNDATEGTFVSQVYAVADFTHMLASWNASIADGSEVEIWARALQGDTWTEWLSWGPYSPFISRGSEENKDGELARIKQDIFTMYEGTAQGVQLKAELRRDSLDVDSPVLRQITVSFDGGDMEATYAEEALDVLPDEVLNAAPAYAQGIRHPSIGGSICSPTTITIMLNGRDPELDLLPEEMALNAQDNGEGIFGNWCFSASAPGLYGYESYVQYGSLEILMQELAQGRSVGLSVEYSPNPESSYPYLEGAYGGTGGHLITIIGYAYEGGNTEDDLYFYSSDTYSAGDATAYHRYKWTQLSEAWNNRVCYLIPSLEREPGAQVTGVERIWCEPIMDEADRTKFTLVDPDGEAIDMSRFTAGGGLLGYTVEGFYTDMENDLVDSACSVIYPNPIQVTANNTFYYDIVCDEDGTLILDTNAVLEKLEVPYGETRDITVYAFSDRGYLYYGTIQAQITADEVIVAPDTIATGSKVLNEVGSFFVNATISATDVEGDELVLGLLVLEDADAEQAVVTLNDETVETLGVYESEEGVSYLKVPVSIDESNGIRTEMLVNWGDFERTYFLDLTAVTKVEDIVAVEGNVVSIDLENGRRTSEYLSYEDGALRLTGIEEIYYSPVYDSFDWEYAMVIPNAYVPGNSSVDVQMRAYAQRGEGWSDWYSLGKLSAGSPATSMSMKGDHVNMDTDVFTMRGDSSVANALRWQVRLVLRCNDYGEECPAVYSTYVTFKKSAYDPTEAVHLGDTAVEDLPAEAGKDIPGYSAYSYNSNMTAWRFENMELIMLNGQGSDLLFEEVALASYDQNAGWGNWNMTNYKPSLFGHKAYSQFGANSTLVQQALADGYVVGLYVHGGKIPSTNSNKSSQTIVYSYYTAEDGTVMFKLICPRGDHSELTSGKIYGECTAAELDEAIVNFSSSSVRGLMYVVGQQEYESSWQRIEAEAKVMDLNNETFALFVDGEQLYLPSDYTTNYKTPGEGGVIAYVISGEIAEGEKLAASNYRYGISVNDDGYLTIPSKLKAELEAFGYANIYVIGADGVTYTAKLQHEHVWDEGVVTVKPTTSKTGVMTYTCEMCGETMTEVIRREIAKPSGPDHKDVEENEPTTEVIKMNFADVSSRDWFYDSVKYVYENELMTGVTGSDFAPYATTTRGMIVTILWRMAGQPVPFGNSQFTDVAHGSYYQLAIAWAAEQGIVNGVTATEFQPDANITREQLAVILFRYAQYMGMDSVVLSENLWFNDADQISAYAIPAMNWAVYEGLISGTGNGNVEPQSVANRAQVATILARFCQK